jgi:CxxC-x17-CxxC domain-containing protein
LNVTPGKIKTTTKATVQPYPARWEKADAICRQVLKCTDCGNDFVFTAGEQLFFFDKQFKNDPKRCKLCKAKRAGLGRSANPNAPSVLPYSRTETRTECSACGIETTVPFKPTQGRPVLCRSCFQEKRVPLTDGMAAMKAALYTSVANATIVDAASRMEPQAILREH